MQEVDLTTGEVVFDWKPLDQGVTLDEVAEKAPWNLGHNKPYPWDFFHANSIDKNEDGDYLVSARWVSTIYKISAVDGSIIWRLGGLKSDFTQDFNFSGQHDARFISENETTTILSLFDNASGVHYDDDPTSTASSGLIVAVNTKEGTAKVRKLSRTANPGHSS